MGILVVDLDAPPERAPASLANPNLPEGNKVIHSESQCKLLWAVDTVYGV